MSATDTAPAVTPWLWYASEAEEAASLYVSILPDSRIDRVTRYPMEGPWGAADSVATVEFTLAGRRFAALNGGARIPHSHAVSLAFECDGQDELDAVWNAFLDAGGTAEQCGWLKDRYGLSWQITPRALGRWMGDPDRRKAARVMAAMLTMGKLDLAALEQAWQGEASA